MNDTPTPTPITDEATLLATDIEQGGNFNAVHVQVAQRLERELTAAREELKAVTIERDEFHVKIEELAIKLQATTEQRDSLHELHNKNAARSKELLELCGTLREQRDRLADLVKQFIYILDITEESDSGMLFHPTNITSCRAGDLQKAGELVEDLRRASRNQPTQ